MEPSVTGATPTGGQVRFCDAWGREEAGLEARWKPLGAKWRFEAASRRVAADTPDEPLPRKSASDQL